MTDPSSLHHSLQLSAGAAGTGLLAVGIVVALLLVAAVWWGIRRRAAEPPPGAPTRPTARRPHHVEEHREPDPESFPGGGERLSPHEMKGYGNLGSRREGGDDPGKPSP
ncbi:DUF6479 family protein [Streptomyces sp. A0592]|uniref:DUF6479 family protein n=1 Tax=Streptomyces sp. A0592 TaxID=2563099 RepID=UPI00109E56BA|nr:DUF6479 family protein [Streptomyces sp. A0592]THA86308.1 hypothetical protein E6U81_04845 [Streptomyces sp. A0592]